MGKSLTRRFRVYVQSESEVDSSSSTKTYALAGLDVEAAIKWARETARRTKTTRRDAATDDPALRTGSVCDDQHRRGRDRDGDPILRRQPHGQRRRQLCHQLVTRIGADVHP